MVKRHERVRGHSSWIGEMFKGLMFIFMSTTSKKSSPEIKECLIGLEGGNITIAWKDIHQESIEVRMALPSSSGQVDPGEPVDSPVQFESLPGYARLPCSPCLFFASRGGCVKGQLCLWCHHGDRRAKADKKRPQKDIREQMKQYLRELVGQIDLQTQQPQEVVRLLQQFQARHSSFARTFCLHEIDRLREALDDGVNPVNTTVPAEEAEGTNDAAETCEGIMCFSL
eukprot:s2981_g6.t3